MTVLFTGGEEGELELALRNELGFCGKNSDFGVVTSGFGVGLGGFVAVTQQLAGGLPWKW
jgi:hypothetical protein